MFENKPLLMAIISRSRWSRLVMTMRLATAIWDDGWTSSHAWGGERI